MPVTPCFDPTTGSSGGASGGGGAASLFDLAFTTVDLTDPSWALFDPDGLIDTVSHSAGFNLVTWNNVVASQDYNWSATGDHRAPRWYRLLTVSGNQVTTASHLVFTSRLQNDPTVNDFNQQIVMGPAINPALIPSLSILGAGGAFTKTTAGNPAYGTWQINASTTGSNAALEYGKTSVLWGGDSAGAGVYINFDNTDNAINSGSRNSNQNSLSGGTVNLYVMVGVGPRLNTNGISAGQQQKFSAGYVATTVLP